MINIIAGVATAQLCTSQLKCVTLAATIALKTSLGLGGVGGVDLGSWEESPGVGWTLGPALATPLKFPCAMPFWACTLSGTSWEYVGPSPLGWASSGHLAQGTGPTLAQLSNKLARLIGPVWPDAGAQAKY